MSIQATRIRERRQKVGMTQEELADRIGTNQRQISKYENGHNDPTADVLAALARALDTTTDWLLGLTDTPERPLRTEADLNEDERELLLIYRSKPAARRKQVVEIAKVV
jgi:transcriptional regulator with XRE-family HTH domain